MVARYRLPAAGRRAGHGPALGARHVQGLFLLPIIGDRGWTRESIGFAMAVQNLTWGIAQPFTGMVADRFGSWKVMLAGLVLYALGLYGMAVITSAPAFMLVAGVCIGVAQSGTTFGVVYGALSRMVPPEDRSRTLGIAGAIGGIGQFLMVPSAQALLSFAGWTNALMVLAVCAAVLIPFALPFRDRAPASDAATGASHRCRCWPPSARLSATRASGCSTSASWHVASIGLIANHLPAYLRDKDAAR
jgi:MFS family permease